MVLQMIASGLSPWALLDHRSGSNRTEPTNHQANASLGHGLLVFSLQREPRAYDYGFHFAAEHLRESIRPSDSLKSRLCAADHPGSAGTQPKLCRCMPEEGPACWELINRRASSGSPKIDPSGALIYNALVSELTLLTDSESHLALNHPCRRCALSQPPGSKH